MAVIEQVSAKALYERLVTDRDPYLKRAETAASLTVPHLMPPNGTTASTALEEPSQSLGARGVRHIASKVQLALFPINTPPFKYEIDDIGVRQLTEGQGRNGEINKALSERERAVVSEMNGSVFRPVAFEACRQLIVAGNYLLHIPKEGRPRGFRLNQHVVDRDGSGNVLDIVVKESMSREALPPEIAAQIGKTEQKDTDRTANIDIYTHIRRVEDKFIVTQQIDDVEVGESGEYPVADVPWLALRLTYIEGENYGRGFVDEYIGDLTALNSLTEALRDGTAQSAKIVWLVAPNSVVKAQALAKAKNGGFVTGEANSVVPLQVNKHADFSVAERFIAQLIERLSFAFMLNSAVQRSGERVTAEEIRYIASELDQGMGGIYSLLSEEFQLPVVKLYEKRMEHNRKVPPLPKGVTSVKVIAGLDALGRGNDLQNLDAFLAGIAQLFGPDEVKRRVNAGEYMTRRGAALGIDTNGLVYTDAELSQGDQQGQMQQMIEKLGPQAIAQMGGMAKEGMKQQAAAPEGTPNG
ncbi:phage tail protein [Sinorhizobium medicae]|uniref:Phage tail protein n=1 Tax=Sinorhizobium medicae TaxID=110321 RepID=A0A6G1WV17_9HYPH|nr:portal protein [Sinorhizobium medicae]MQW73455.1 phage tail protein [Sinorhizobium medicae]MQX85550.1 phage tail protein [Sinorhizobium medicae]